MSNSEDKNNDQWDGLGWSTSPYIEDEENWGYDDDDEPDVFYDDDYDDEEPDVFYDDDYE
jgi:hypothetical protein